MEEVLKQILNELKVLKSDVTGLKQGQEELKEKVNNQGTIAGVILDMVKKTDEKVSRIEKKLNKHDASLRTHSTRCNELELRVELLEDGLLPPATGK